MADVELVSVHGWDVLRMTTDHLRLDVVPGLGGTVLSLRRRSDDVELLWQAPWGLRPRGSATLPGNSTATMIDSFVGGWQTLFPNGGDTATVYGVDWGVDGEARVAPFDWEQTGSSLILRARLVRSPFEVSKIISMRGSQVTVGETVRNVGGESLEVMWGSQVILGAPLLSGHTVVDAAAAVVRPDPENGATEGYDDITPWPRMRKADSMVNLTTPPVAGSRDSWLAYLSDFRTPNVTVSNPELDVAVDLEWDLRTWPYLWYALETGDSSGFPWYRAGYFLALTASTSWPAHGIHAARRVSQSTRWVDPGAALTSHLGLTVRGARATGPLAGKG